MSQLNTSHTQQQVGSGKLVIVALVLAVLAVVLVNVYIVYIQQVNRPNEITVYRLTVPVRTGDKLTRKMFEASSVDESYRDALGNPLNERSIDTRINEEFARSARQGQVLTSDLFVSSDLQRLDMQIDRGKRGFALDVESNTVPGALRAGVYVDIAAPFRTRDGQLRILPVMENVQVMAAGTRSIIDEQDDPTAGSVPRKRFRRIDIQVTPNEALKLAEIKREKAGPFEIFVRNPGDKNFELIRDGDGSINEEVLKLLP